MSQQKNKGRSWRGTTSALVAFGFLSWCVYEGARGLLDILERGSIRNRRGPDIDVSENPLVFWGLNGFFGLSIILAAGLAAICLFAVFQAFSRKSVS